ncbi:MAG: hypothetical protein WAL95_02860 [Candidatus Acidiferrales bacterium]
MIFLRPIQPFGGKSNPLPLILKRGSVGPLSAPDWAAPALECEREQSYLQFMAPDIVNAAKEVYNAVQKYNDVPLMKQVVELQQAVLDLQSELIATKKQLDHALAKLDVRHSMHKRGEYFFKDGDPEPYCPKCWQQDSKLVYLPALKTSSTYGKIRQCIVCKEMFIEEAAPTQRQITPRGSTWG